MSHGDGVRGRPLTIVAIGPSASSGRAPIHTPGSGDRYDGGYLVDGTTGTFSTMHRDPTSALPAAALGEEELPEHVDLRALEQQYKMMGWACLCVRRRDLGGLGN